MRYIILYCHHRNHFHFLFFVFVSCWVKRMRPFQHYKSSWKVWVGAQGVWRKRLHRGCRTQVHSFRWFHHWILHTQTYWQDGSLKLKQLNSPSQELFGHFQHFIDGCSHFKSTALDEALSNKKRSDLSFLPKPTMIAHRSVLQLGYQSFQTIEAIVVNISVPLYISSWSFRARW